MVVQSDTNKLVENIVFFFLVSFHLTVLQKPIECAASARIARLQITTIIDECTASFGEYNEQKEEEEEDEKRHNRICRKNCSFLFIE